MKLKALFLIAALVATPTVASAQDFTGPRVEANASVTDVTNVRGRDDVTYGGTVGFDVPLGTRLVAGVEASSDNPFDNDRTIGAAARIGYVASDRVLLYAKGGYDNYRLARNLTLDGLRLGGGVEVNVSNNAYVKLEGRYTDFSRGVGRAGALAGVGLRF